MKWIYTLMLAVPLWGAYMPCDSPQLLQDQGFPWEEERSFQNLKVTFQGMGVPVSCGEEVVGYYFEGKGEYRLPLPSPPFDVPNKENIKENSSFNPDAEEISDSFHHALVLLPDLTFSGNQRVNVDSSFFDQSIKNLENSLFTGLDHLLAYRQDPRWGQSSFLFLEGKKEEVFYYADEDWQNLEVLAKWYPTSFGMTTKTIVSAPLQSPLRKKFIYPAYLVDLLLELNSPDNEQLEENATVTVEVKNGGFKTLSFSLTNGRSRFPEKWDKRKLPFKVLTVTDGKGNRLAFSHRYDELLIYLPNPAKKGERLTFTIRAEGKLLKNLQGDSYLVLGNFPYYPSFPTEAQSMRFHAKVTVQKPYVAIIAGKTLKRTETEKTITIEGENSGPVSFPMIVVGNFISQSTRKKGYDLSIYSYVNLKEKGGKKMLKNGLSILDFFSNGLIPFPWEELKIVEIPYYRHFFWQSPAGIVLITSEAFNPMGGAEDDVDTILRRLASQGVNARYAHEVAHQWYGNLVSWGSPYDNWLSESFAEYLSYLFMEKVGGRKKAKAQIKIWEGGTKESSSHASVYAAAMLSTPFAGTHYTNLLYGKGPLVLHALRQEIGDQAFFKALKLTAMAAHKMKIKAITEDFILILNNITGKDWHPWFDRYIYGTEIPPLAKDTK